MRLVALVACSLAFARASAADPAPRKPTKSELAATRWLATMVATKDGVVAASRPLAYASDASCLRSGGVATTVAELRRIKSCLRANAEGDVQSIEEGARPLLKLAPPAMAAAMKDLTLVRALYDGPSGDGTYVFLGVAVDGSVRAVWLHLEWLE